MPMRCARSRTTTGGFIWMTLLPLSSTMNAGWAGPRRCTQRACGAGASGAAGRGAVVIFTVGCGSGRWSAACRWRRRLRRHWRAEPAVARRDGATAFAASGLGVRQRPSAVRQPRREAARWQPTARPRSSRRSPAPGREQGALALRCGCGRWRRNVPVFLFDRLGGDLVDRAGVALDGIIHRVQLVDHFLVRQAAALRQIVYPNTHSAVCHPPAGWAASRRSCSALAACCTAAAFSAPKISVKSFKSADSNPSSEWKPPLTRLSAVFALNPGDRRHLFDGARDFLLEAQLGGFFLLDLDVPTGQLGGQARVLPLLADRQRQAGRDPR